MRGLSTGQLGQKSITTPPAAGHPMEVAFFVPEASRKMTEPAEERSAATSGNLARRILLTQLVLCIALALLFWGMDGNVAAYSALLGGLTCVVVITSYSIHYTKLYDASLSARKAFGTTQARPPSSAE